MFQVFLLVVIQRLPLKVECSGYTAVYDGDTRFGEASFTWEASNVLFGMARASRKGVDSAWRVARSDLGLGATKMRVPRREVAKGFKDGGHRSQLSQMQEQRRD